MVNMLENSDFSPRVPDERINEGELIDLRQTFRGKKEQLQFANQVSDSAT